MTHPPPMESLPGSAFSPSASLHLLTLASGSAHVCLVAPTQTLHNACPMYSWVFCLFCCCVNGIWPPIVSSDGLNTLSHCLCEQRSAGALFGFQD